jgi:protein phosphatase
LYAERDYQNACAALQRAFEIAPSFKMRVNLARCWRELGDYAQAVDQLEAHLREGGADIAPPRRAEIEQELTDLKTRLAKLRVTTNVSDSDLLIDQKALGKVVRDAVHVVNPGHHQIWVMKQDHYPASKEIDAESGQNIELVMELRPMPRARASRVTRLLASPAGRVGTIVLPVCVVGLASWVVLKAMKRRNKEAVGSDPSEFDVAANATPEVPPTKKHVVPIMCDPDLANANASPPLVLESGALQDIGRVKPTNQDSYILDRTFALFAVADGIGGNAGGGLASATAVRAIEHRFGSGTLEVGQLSHLPKEAAELAMSVYSANGAIRRRQAVDWNNSEMGTTCVAARFCDGARRMYVAHVGDSRAYRLRQGKLEQLTTDHTMAELGMVGPRANHLSRALGSDPCPKMDVLFVRPQPNDTYLFCSDGLTKMMTVEQVAEVLGRPISVEAAAAALVKLANDQGGQDNITVVLVRVSRSAETVN